MESPFTSELVSALVNGSGMPQETEFWPPPAQVLQSGAPGVQRSVSPPVFPT
jgi:hypothetical protein